MMDTFALHTLLPDTAIIFAINGVFFFVLKSKQQQNCGHFTSIPPEKQRVAQKLFLGSIEESGTTISRNAKTKKHGACWQNFGMMQAVGLTLQTVDTFENTVQCLQLLNKVLDLQDFSALVNNIQQTRQSKLTEWRSAFTTKFLHNLKNIFSSEEKKKKTIAVGAGGESGGHIPTIRGAV